MSKQHPRAVVTARQHAPQDLAEPPKDAARPQPSPQGPAQAYKALQKKAEARRKLPFGPIGGSGRKTNVSRSR